MIWGWLTSKLTQLAALVAAALGVFAVVRRGAKKEQEAEQKDADRERANEIRRRVDESRRQRVRGPDAEDDRGYRD